MLVLEHYTELRLDDEGKLFEFKGERWIDLPNVILPEAQAFIDAQERAAVQLADSNTKIINNNIFEAFTELRAFRDRTSTTLSNVQAIAILKIICQVLIWLGRIALKRMDGKD